MGNKIMEMLYIGSIIKDDKGEEYSLVEFLKNGGFGCVFLSERASNKKRFAVKTFLPVFGILIALPLLKMK